jgi:hypothetical protein
MEKLGHQSGCPQRYFLSLVPIWNFEILILVKKFLIGILTDRDLKDS